MTRLAWCCHGLGHLHDPATELCRRADVDRLFAARIVTPL